MNATVTKIWFHVSGNLFDGWDSELLKGINEKASAEKFAEVLEEKLEEHFPDAEVEYEIDLSVTGCTPRCKVEIDGGDWESEHETIALIEHIDGKLFEKASLWIDDIAD